MQSLRRKREKILFFGTYVPEPCGIATFTRDLLHAVKQNNGSDEYSCCAVDRLGRDYSASREVCCTLPRDSRSDYIIRARQISWGEFSLVNVQHEYGIYGGERGEFLLSFLENLDVPAVSTLHTLSLSPSPRELALLKEVCMLSRAVVVMSRTAASILERIYGVPPDRVTVIPHGVPDAGAFDGDGENLTEKLGLKGKKVISTFGLLSKGKGIEYVISAMPQILRAHPDAVYLVIGRTHPTVKSAEKESYRNMLKGLCVELGVSDAVYFVDEYLTLEKLVQFLKLTDIYVTPYLNPNQAVSGTLAYALGCGKAIVSTPYLYASEMLSHGRGMLVPYKSAESIAENVIDAFSNPGKLNEYMRRAQSAGKKMIWKKVGKEYHRLYEHVLVRDRWTAPPYPKYAVPQYFYDARAEKYPFPVM